MLKDIILNLKSVNNLTNAEIAAAAKISERTVNRLLSGELTNPTLHILVGLSECFNVPIDSICGIRNERIVRPDEVYNISRYRMLSPKYKKMVTDNIDQVVAIWRKDLDNSFNFTKRQQFHTAIDSLPLFKLLEYEDLLKNEKT